MCAARPNITTLPCACANLRRAARAVTRFYNHELRDSGLEMTQFTLLMALDLLGETTQGNISKMLATDSTTLTRTLNVLIAQKWVNARPGEDRSKTLGFKSTELLKNCLQNGVA